MQKVFCLHRQHTCIEKKVVDVSKISDVRILFAMWLTQATSADRYRVVSYRICTIIIRTNGIIITLSMPTYAALTTTYIEHTRKPISHRRKAISRAIQQLSRCPNGRNSPIMYHFKDGLQQKLFSANFVGVSFHSFRRRIENPHLIGLHRRIRAVL